MVGVLHEDHYTFLIISRPVILRMRNVSNESCRENQNSRFIFTNCYKKNRAVYEIMWKDVLQSYRPQVTIRHMRIACWITNATHKHTHTHTHNV